VVPAERANECEWCDDHKRVTAALTGDRPTVSLKRPNETPADARFAAQLGNQQRDVIDEAPRPLLARLERADDRVAVASGVALA